MSRTVLAAAALIGFVACGGGTERPNKRAPASAPPAAGTPRTAQPQKKKATTKPDTTRAKNPLTN